MREGTTAALYRQPMRWAAFAISVVTFGLAIIVSLATLGLGLFLFFLSFILINRSSNTGLMATGVFFVLVGLGSLWIIYRARRRNKPSR